MKWTLLLVLLVGVLFSGCEEKLQFASTAKEFTPKTEKEKQLSKRALKYWELFSSKKFDETYSYELPFQRYENTLKWYHKFNKGNDEGYKLVQKEIVEIDENRAIVKTVFQGKKATFIMSDKWYLVNDTWYHKMNTSKLPTLETW